MESLSTSSRGIVGRMARCGCPALALACFIAGGCVMERQSRERYMESRSAMVESRPGDGSVRMSLWPGVSGTRAAMASGRTLDTSLAATAGDGE